MSYTQTKWNLNDLFSGYESPELQAAFEQVEEQVTSFEGVRGKLKSEMDADQFLEVVKSSEATSRVISKLYGFAGLSFAANTQDQAAQILQARVDQFAAEIQNRTLFFNLWWKGLDEVNAARLMNASACCSLNLAAGPRRATSAGARQSFMSSGPNSKSASR